MLYLYIRINIIKLPEPVKYPFDLSIGSAAKVNSPFFYSYFVVIAFLIISVFLIYRRIYLKFSDKR